MEAIISISVIIFVLFISLYVEKFMYRKPISIGEVTAYQKVLNKADRNLKDRWDIEWKRDAHTELKRERKQKKSLVLIFSGFFLTFILIFSVLYFKPSLDNIFVFAGSSFILICYGIIKMSESTRIAFKMLVSLFVFFVLIMLVIEKLMSISSYSYFYLCGVVLVVAIVSLLSKGK